MRIIDGRYFAAEILDEVARDEVGKVAGDAGRVCAEFKELLGELVSMGSASRQLMINASAALLQADLVLAELVITRGDEMTAQHHDVEQRCLTRLAPHAPAAMGLRTVVAALHVSRDLQRMGSLAQHTAKIVQLTHPTLFPDDVCTVIAQMSLLAGGLAHQAATAIEELDPLSGNRLAGADDEVDSLRGHLLRIVFAEDWSYGSGPAAHAALVGRYCERFADHAVAIARQVCHLATESDQLVAADNNTAAVGQIP